MTTQRAGPANDDTMLPDEMAIDYLRSALSEIERLAKDYIEVGNNDTTEIEDRVAWVEEGYPTDEQWNKIFERTQFNDSSAHKIKKNYAIRDLFEDHLYHHDYEEYYQQILEVENYTAQAIEALHNENIDEFLNCYDAIILYIDNYSPDQEEDNNMEHWAEIVRSSRFDVEEIRQGDEIHSAVAIAVKELSVALAKLIANNRKALMSIEWRQLEHAVAAALEGLGFQVELTPPSKDGGKDIVALCFLLGKKITYFIEIKHWKSGKKVGSGLIMDFIEVNIKDRTDGGLFLSTSGFSDTMFSCVTELQEANVDVGGSDRVVWICRQFARKSGGIWEPSRNLSDVFFSEPERDSDKPNGARSD